MSEDRTESPDDVSLARELLEMITGSWRSQAVHVAAELGIADLLANGPRTSDELAAKLDAHAPSLQRLLRALTTIGICRERADGSFEMTPMGSLLGSGVSGSLRSWAIWWGAHLWPVWGNLLYSVRTGKSARAKLSGKEGFGHLEGDPAAAAVFNEALVELTRLECECIVRSYDFSGLKRIVDVGGGYGELLAGILMANPSSRGVLFDMPHAIAGARLHLEKVGLADRCEFVAGDFFEAVPAGGDAYVLKSVIHDWQADRARLILENCRMAMGNDARLLLVEQMMPDRLGTSPAHQSLSRSDLTMLAAHAAQERSESELNQLLAAAGFVVAQIVPAGPTFSIIEAFSRR